MSKNDRLLDTAETVHSFIDAGIQDLKHVETNDVLHHVGKSADGGTENRKVQTSEAKFPKDDSQDATHWKELLLLHLDLIQQQREMLLSKDRQIKTLSQEKETLKCRLERMDRRMSLLRQQKFHSNGFPMTPQQTQCDVSTGLPAASPSLRASRLKNQLGGHKRKKSWLTPQNLNKRFASTTTTAATSAAAVCDADDETLSRISRHRSTSCSSGGVAAPHKDTIVRRHSHRHSDSTQSKTQSQPGASSNANDRVSDSSGSNYESSSKGGMSARRRRRRIGPSKEELLLHTDLLYYVPTYPQWTAKPESDTDSEVIVVTITPFGEEEVPVPSWQYNRIQTGYQMEGTENLEDEIFLKRHQKPEADERRRKRWDMQRLRERQLLEKVQQSHAEGRSNSAKEDGRVSSFLPHIDKLTHIEVCDAVPVSVFGYPLPKIHTQEFELPWFDGQGKKENTRLMSRTRNR